MSMLRNCTYTEEEFRDAVVKSTSVAQVLKRLGLSPAGGNYQGFHKRVKEWDIDTSHFVGQAINKGKTFGPKRPLEAYLSNDHPIKSHNLRCRLLKEGVFPYECSRCKLSEWQDQPIPLELDHIDGNHEDNSLSNLRILCPNCHALTDTYRGRNKKK